MATNSFIPFSAPRFDRLLAELPDGLAPLLLALAGYMGYDSFAVLGGALAVP